MTSEEVHCGVPTKASAIQTPIWFRQSRLHYAVLQTLQRDLWKRFPDNSGVETMDFLGKSFTKQQNEKKSPQCLDKVEVLG